MLLVPTLASSSLAELKRLTSKPADHPTAAALPDLEKTQASETGAQAAPEQSSSNHLPATLGAIAPIQVAPQDFDEVGPGSLVLAWDEEVDAWYEAIVVLAQGDHFWLRWRDYPSERQVQCRRDQLALLYPKAA